jgi:hypothetical protein
VVFEAEVEERFVRGALWEDGEFGGYTVGVFELLIGSGLLTANVDRGIVFLD